MLLQLLFRSVPSLRQWDRQRHSLPAEHWATFALGMYLMKRRRSGPLGWLLSRAAGAGLLARALSGRDGPAAMYRRVQQRQDGLLLAGPGGDSGRMSRATPRSAAPEKFVEVAAPWPYDQRVRVSTDDSGARH